MKLVPKKKMNGGISRLQETAMENEYINDYVSFAGKASAAAEFSVGVAVFLGTIPEPIISKIGAGGALTLAGASLIISFLELEEDPSKFNIRESYSRESSSSDSRGYKSEIINVKSLE